MTFKEMTIATFEHKARPHVLFQPRIESWYRWHKLYDQMPARFRHLNSVLDLYDDLHVSMRYAFYNTMIPVPIETVYSNSVKITESTEGDVRTKVIETPYGPLTRVEKRPAGDLHAGWKTIAFPCKAAEDIKKLIWFYEKTSYHFSQWKFETNIAFIGDRGEAQIYPYPTRSPYQTLCLEWMDFSDFVYLLNDNRKDMENLMDIMDLSCDPMYEEIVASGKVRIVNFGENIEAQFLMPEYFEKYLMPFYQKRSNQLRKAGIFTHLHIDGNFKPLFRYFNELPFDGLESLTFTPMGEVDFEETKEFIGDKIILDGIPATIFMPEYSEAYFIDYVERFVKLFQPNLILGISGELPQNAGEEAVERVRWVSDYCRGMTG